MADCLSRRKLFNKCVNTIQSESEYLVRSLDRARKNDTSLSTIDKQFLKYDILKPHKNHNWQYELYTDLIELKNGSSPYADINVENINAKTGKDVNTRISPGRLKPKFKPSPDPKINAKIDKDVNVKPGGLEPKFKPSPHSKINVKTDKDVNVNPGVLDSGRAYIINNFTFDAKLPDRNGSEFDVRRLQTVLSLLHFSIALISDGTVADIKAVTKEISSIDFKKFSCLMIVIMSHGFERSKIAAKDGTYHLYRDIIYPIQRNKSLKSKLKLLVTNACRGTVNPFFFESDGRFLKPKFPTEFLQLYSCSEGFVSFRNPEEGSTFITILCDHLEKHGFEIDVLAILMKVVADVEEKFAGHQVPTVETNLTKKYVFGRYGGLLTI